jgi:NAD(P)-dependent dehydrogenase (short-subunit alcohol dehydrogenase family)
VETARALAAANAEVTLAVRSLEAGNKRVLVAPPDLADPKINGEVLFDDINFLHHPYDPWVAYSQSKTANILFAVEASKRWAADGITANALNPGRIVALNPRRIERPRHVRTERHGCVVEDGGAGRCNVGTRRDARGAQRPISLARRDAPGA